MSVETRLAKDALQAKLHTRPDVSGDKLKRSFQSEAHACLFIYLSIYLFNDREIVG